MFQLAFVAVLFTFRYRPPSFSPLLQLPNRRATAGGTAPPHSPVRFRLSVSDHAGRRPGLHGGVAPCGAPPYPPGGRLHRHAHRWQKKQGRAEVPAGSRGCVAHSQKPAPSIQPVAASAEPKGHCRDLHVLPQAVAAAGGGTALIRGDGQGSEVGYGLVFVGVENAGISPPQASRPGKTTAGSF